MLEDKVDLFVIGAGSGGVRAARIAAGHGARVMIAEEYRVGGTCVIRGCVPKKLLVYASRFADEFEDAAGKTPAARHRRVGAAHDKSAIATHHSRQYADDRDSDGIGHGNARSQRQPFLEI